MLGRVRPSSSSSLEVLELERMPSKIIKDDSLSIYETTLMKLKQGSRHVLSSFPEDSKNTNISCTSANIPTFDKAMAIDSDCSSATTSPSSSDCQSMGTSKDQPKRNNMSVLYMFSRYKSPRHAQSSSDEEPVVMENGCFSVSPSYSPSDSQTISSTIQHL